MPKATLEYSMPEEREEFELAVNGAALAAGVDEFSSWLFRRFKYERAPTEDYAAAFEEVKEKFKELVRER